jgi:hypothetical protein
MALGFVGGFKLITKEYLKGERLGSFYLVGTWRYQLAWDGNDVVFVSERGVICRLTECLLFAQPFLEQVELVLIGTGSLVDELPD